MNPIMILKIMGEMGARYRESKINDIVDYTTRMCDNGRIIIISDKDEPFAVLFFSVTNDPDKFLNKGQYEFMSHDPCGKILCVEKLISRGWNKELRTEFESKITEKFPQITHGVWYRYGKVGDRKVIAKVRRRLECTK